MAWAMKPNERFADFAVDNAPKISLRCWSERSDWQYMEDDLRPVGKWYDENAPPKQRHTAM